MGKAARRKKQTQAQRRDGPQLIGKIRQQAELLRVLGEQFDTGHRVLGYPLATTIRVLVYDTGTRRPARVTRARLPAEVDEATRRRAGHHGPARGAAWELVNRPL